MEYVANVWVVGRFDVYCLMMMGLHVFDELFSVSCSWHNNDNFNTNDQVSKPIELRGFYLNRSTLAEFYKKCVDWQTKVCNYFQKKRLYASW